jgi:hypothetical protein
VVGAEERAVGRDVWCGRRNGACSGERSSLTARKTGIEIAASATTARSRAKRCAGTALGAASTTSASMGTRVIEFALDRDDEFKRPAI